jgi:nitrate reductase NapE component
MTTHTRARCASRRKHNSSSRSRSVADLVFVVLTVVLFAALTVLIRAVERW